jgi:CPA2 family monovalent cation:H+ antiporter-2
MTLDLLPKEGNSLILAGALISIALNPLIFSTVQPLLQWLQRNPKWAARLEMSESPLAELPMSTEAKYLANQVVIVGWGRVGKLITRALKAQGIPFVVAESNRESVESLRAKGIPAVWGDATEPMVLIQAHIRDARALVIATPDTLQVRKMVETARTLNPDIHVVVRSHNAEEAQRLETDGAGTVFVGETELAKAMIGHVLGLVEPAAPVVATRH